MRTFSLAELHAALERQRQARGLTWADVTRQINAVGPQPPRHPIAASTIAGLRTKTLAEGAGVLQMLRWLGRSPESFVDDCPADVLAASHLPDGGSQRVLRVDTRKLHEALDSERRARGLSWSDMARETGVPASHARGLARGGRTAFPAVMLLTGWLRRPVADFVRVSDM